MTDSTAVTKAKNIDKIEIGSSSIDYDVNEYFEKFRPDQKSKCTWTKDACPKDSPHHHDENMLVYNLFSIVNL